MNKGCRLLTGSSCHPVNSVEALKEIESDDLNRRKSPTGSSSLFHHWTPDVAEGQAGQQSYINDEA